MEDSLEVLCILSSLGTSWDPPGKCRWGERCLGFLLDPVASATRLRKNGRKWMDEYEPKKGEGGAEYLSFLPMEQHRYAPDYTLVPKMQPGSFYKNEYCWLQISTRERNTWSQLV